jgi:cation:H+ antiporter
VTPLPDAIDLLGLTSVWTYLALFLTTSLLMIWRLEAMLDHGLEGTALGTLVMPYCSGLGNLIFVALIAAGRGAPQEVLTNCLVNNVTNLTIILGLPALFWGLQLNATKKATKSSSKAVAKSGGRSADTAQQLNRLSLLLTLMAVLFFTGVTWALGSDGQLGRTDGLVLIALFLFWQCFQVFDVLKHNVRQRHAFGPLFYLDLFIVVLGAYGLYVSIDWLMTWLSGQKGEFINEQHLGWLSGWLMVLPNALLAFFFAAKRRADVVFASQIGDGHICIPLCLGLSAAIEPLSLPSFFEAGIAILAGAAIVHAICVSMAGGLPRWMGWPLIGAYAVFVGVGLFK